MPVTPYHIFKKGSGTPLAIYHLSIKVISKSRGASAVAKAAYRSGQKLHNERTGLSHDFTKKHGVVHSEVMLCRNAPKEYRDREILWNAVERIEKNSNAQLAREIEFALPIEFDEKARLEVTREFLQHFVDEGMCVDWSYHNKEFGRPNPHIHAMLTMRGIKADGTWDSKEKKTYALAKKLLLSGYVAWSTFFSYPLRYFQLSGRKYFWVI